ncbi:hypothetical protein JCM14469_37970 [Desulfatiferula olefinivorans]
MADGLKNPVRVPAHVVAAGLIHPEQFHIAGNDIQGIVELMGQSSGQVGQHDVTSRGTMAGLFQAIQRQEKPQLA